VHLHIVAAVVRALDGIAPLKCATNSTALQNAPQTRKKLIDCILEHKAPLAQLWTRACMRSLLLNVCA
jgi:hypothetical protein